MQIQTISGNIELPAFFPDGTRAVVRSVDAIDVSETKTPGVVMNTYHLMTHPGAKVIKQLGGLHEFCGWKKPILTDSGGFQVFSLLSENPSLGSIQKNEIIFTPSKEKGKISLSPEKVIEAQMSWGADIMMCLDYCTHPNAPEEINRVSVETTIRWAKQCKEKYQLLIDQKSGKGKLRPLLYAIIQGGSDRQARKECADALIDLGFDGYGFGGWPFDKDIKLVNDILAYTAELMPDETPKYAMGIGKPENIVACAQMGYNLFDCVIPTRDARHLRLYQFNEESLDKINILEPKFYSILYMQDWDHKRDPRPISTVCDCYCCTHYSRAYLHHLFKIEDGLACRLATIHNLRFYSQLMDLIKRKMTR